MRWVMFISLAAVLLAVQSALAPRVELAGARPDWLLVTVVFFALHARAKDAVLGAWMIGGCADLMTLERFGLMALSYVLVAMAVLSFRDFLFRHRRMTQFLVTLAACLAVRSIWTVYRCVMYGPPASPLIDMTTDVLIGSLYTAVWALPLHAGLLRMRNVFGLAQARYRYAG